MTMQQQQMQRQQRCVEGSAMQAADVPGEHADPAQASTKAKQCTGVLIVHAHIATPVASRPAMGRPSRAPAGTALSTGSACWEAGSKRTFGTRICLLH